jgi:hypothetical protein
MEEKNSQRADFLIEAYKTRIQFFSDHANRTWARFNILLTMNVVLFGWFFSILFGNGTSTSSLWLLPILGMFVSLVWYVLGAQDRYAYVGLREQINLVERMVTEEVNASDLPSFNSSGIKIKYDWLTWRVRSISLSRLPALFPLLFVLVWVLAVVFLALR